MFGISFAKVLVLVAVIAIVWFGFKYLQRVEAMRSGGLADKRRPASPKRAEPETVQAVTHDMTACRVCGTYVEANRTTSCGRADCIFGR